MWTFWGEIWQSLVRRLHTPYKYIDMYKHRRRSFWFQLLYARTNPSESVEPFSVKKGRLFHPADCQSSPLNDDRKSMSIDIVPYSRRAEKGGKPSSSPLSSLGFYCVRNEGADVWLSAKPKSVNSYRCNIFSDQWCTPFCIGIYIFFVTSLLFRLSSFGRQRWTTSLGPKTILWHHHEIFRASNLISRWKRVGRRH